jgi:predicted MFS family arabinose efflux permease
LRPRSAARRPQTLAIAVFVPNQGRDNSAPSIGAQLSAFRDRNLLASLAITALGWVGFMAFYGYIAQVAERVAGFSAADLTWVLVIVGIGLVIGNTLGGRTADANLRLSLILWPAAMIVSLIVAGFAAPFVPRRGLRLRHRVVRQCAAAADARHEIRQGRAGTCRDRKHLGL